MQALLQFDTRLAGIPCQVAVTEYEPVVRGNRRGHPDNWSEDEGGVVAFDLLDRRGRPAPWLVRKMTPKDEARIYNEIEEEFASEQD